MSEVEINCDQVVSWLKHEDPRFKTLCNRMQTDFADRDYGYRICLHEAGHALLMELDGLKNVRFSGPEIYYNFQIDEFGANGARVHADDQPEAVVDDAYKFMATMHAVAGGVALRKIKGLEGKEAGDGGDYADFLRLYRKNPPKNGESADSLWKRAENAVSTRLDDAAIKERFWQERTSIFISYIRMGKDVPCLANSLALLAAGGLRS